MENDGVPEVVAACDVQDFAGDPEEERREHIRDAEDSLVVLRDDRPRTGRRGRQALRAGPAPQASARVRRRIPPAWAAVVQTRIVSPAVTTSARGAAPVTQVCPAAPGSQRAVSPRSAAS